MKPFKKILPVLVALGMLSSCTGTKMLETWTNESYEGSEVGKIAVLTIHPRLDVRKTQQAYLVSMLEEEGYEAVGGLELFSPEFIPTAENMEAFQSKLLAEGVDQVLTVSLLDVEKSRTYVPGQTNVVPRVYYNPFGRYFVRTYQRVYEPGYYREDAEAILETKLFDVDSGELIWTGQSATPQMNSNQAFARDAARGILQALSRERIL